MAREWFDENLSDWHRSLNDEGREKVDGWREYLVEFQRDMLPVFCAFGFTPGEAFIAFQLQRVYNQLLEVEDAVVGDGPDEWD